MTVPVWEVTRTAPGRRLFEALAARGVVLSRLEEFRRALGGSVPDPSPPSAVSIVTDAPGERSLPDPMDRPELTDRDRVVVAVADGRVVGVQPITLDRPFHVEPLDRTIAFDGAYFWGLYVDPAWRRRGVATALVGRALVHVADRTALDRVHTLVGADNVPSKRVLRGVGFERAVVRSYYRLGPVERRTRREVDGAGPARAG